MDEGSVTKEEKEAILHDLAELTAASVAVAMADYSALLPVFAKIEESQDKSTFIRQLNASAGERAHALLILARSLVQYGKELNDLAIDEDPRILLPLLHALADSFAIIALSRSEDDLQMHLLLDGDGLDRMLTPDVVLFIREWGQERAKMALE
jgi:hypothetical protein